MKHLFFVLALLGSLQAAEPAPLTQRWAFSTMSSATQGDLISSPAIGVDGTVYVGVEIGATGLGATTGAVFAVAKDGTLKWRYDTPDWVDASPLVLANGAVVFGCWDGNLYCVGKDGALLWKYQAGGFIASSAAVGTDGALYFGVGDGNLTCLNADGTLRWVSPTADWVDSSPAVAPDGTVYFGGWDNSLHAIGPSGVEKWKYPTLGDVVSSPAVAADGTVYFASRDHGIYAVSPAGALKWKFDAGAIIDASPVLGTDGTVYVGTLGGRVFALTPAGTEKWRYPAAALPGLHSLYSTVAVRNDGSLLFGTSDNTLTCLRSDGSLAFTMPLGDWADSSPVVGTDGSVYIGCSDKKLYAFDGASPELATEWGQSRRNSRHEGLQVFGRVAGGAGRLVNLSTRAVAGSGGATLINGFVVLGTGTRHLLVRGVGPTLGVFGVSGVMTDPRLTAFNAAVEAGANDNWWLQSDGSQIGGQFPLVGAFGLPAASLDAALLVDAGTGDHSVHVTSADGASGAVLMEVYDAGGDETARVANLSARSHVGVDGNILIAGFVIRGGSHSLVIRAAGPVLGAFGVSGALANPQFRLYSEQTLIAENDDWEATTSAEFVSDASSNVGAFGFPAGGKDAAMVVTLPPGNYTAQISGVDRTEGVALVELYELP